VDYGLDRLACLWIAAAPDGKFYVYRELCESNLTISEAARKILDLTPNNEDIYATLAPPDLWSRSQETGRSKATLFSEYGINFTKTANDREAGWLCLKELLATDTPRLRIFSTCPEIISCLPALQIDKLRPSDCATEPHAITHAPDALRGFAIFYARPENKNDDTPRVRWTKDMWEDYYSAKDEERKYLKRKYGEPI
jgi:phage terminase large subunit